MGGAVDTLRARVHSPLLWNVAAWPLGLLLRVGTGLIAGSSRETVRGPGAAHAGPALYVNWHRYLPYLGIHHGRFRRWLMVSRDPYMAPIVRWNQLHGVRVVRGGSGAGGQQALAAMVKSLQAGDSAFLAVDGPAGPALHCKRGCVDIARAAGVPIIPVGYSCVRGRFSARRWDHWLMMAPFDRITVTYGRPLVLAADEPLQDALERVTRGLAEASDSRPDPNAWSA